MVKSYLRYQLQASFGVISSPSSNVLLLDHANGKSGRLSISGCLDTVNIWNLRQSTLVAALKDQENSAEVVYMAMNKAKSQLAVGYGDGSIRIWSISSRELIITFRGHTSGISFLCYSPTGGNLLSGSRNGDIVLWDITSEAGTCRFRGHREAITGLIFIDEDKSCGCFLSCSKDGLLKVWDIQQKYCIETNVAHKFEITAMDYDGRFLLTSSVDGMARIFKLHTENVAMPSAELSIIEYYGNVERNLKDKIVGLKFSAHGRLLFVQNGDKVIEVYMALSAEECKKKLNRRKKRVKEKSGKKERGLEESGDVDVALKPGDEFSFWSTVRVPNKIKSFHAPDQSEMKADRVQLLVGYFQNYMELYSVSISDKTLEPSMDIGFDQQGHRNDIRILQLSSNSEMISSASSDALKVWNTQTGQCIRTIELDTHPTAAVFVPGHPSDQYIILGDKGGSVCVVDISSGKVIEKAHQTHAGTVWSMALKPSAPWNTFMTGGADKQVHFWQLDIQDPLKKQLSLNHTRTLKMTDDVLCVRYSPNAKLIALALLDCTVKVFFEDSVKFYLSLYGHKLPVLSIDISSDSHLLVTASSDKNVKIWGLDFGDCHRSIFAHDEAILSVVFVPNTHYFFTSSKDTLIKYWDGDKFEMIHKLKGHHGPVWSLCISKNGSLLVSGSADKSIKLWSKSEEHVFIAEEKEKEMELLMDASLVNDDVKNKPLDGDLDDQIGSAESGLPTVKNIEAIKASEKLFEVIELAIEEINAMAEYHQVKSSSSEKPSDFPQRSPLLTAYAQGRDDVPCERIVLSVAEKVHAADLEQALLVLPLYSILHFLGIVQYWIDHSWNAYLCSKIITFLIKLHGDQLIHHKGAKVILEKIKEATRGQIKHQRFLQREHQLTHESDFLADLEELSKKSEIKRKIKS